MAAMDGKVSSIEIGGGGGQLSVDDIEKNAC